MVRSGPNRNGRVRQVGQGVEWYGQVGKVGYGLAGTARTAMEGSGRVR